MKDQMAKRVLVVGAGGFAGGFICEECLRRGYEVWAGVRASTSRQYLQDPRLNFAVLDFDRPEEMEAALKSALQEKNADRWDYIIYNLGATKCLNFADFNRINYQYLREFTEALVRAGLVPDKLLYISSLSAMGPGDERGYSPYREDMIPMANTRYGASKLKAEMWLATCGIPSIIFRATGIYGPRDKDYFLMFKSIRNGFDFSVGYRKQLLSFLYVEDLARACCDALEHGRPGQTYIVGEPNSYSQKEFRKMVAEALGKKMVLPVRLPLWAVKMVSAVAEKIGVAKGKPSTLNSDKYKIMAQRNWNIDVSKARDEFGFNPTVTLREGIERSVDWYQKEGWLSPLRKR